MRSRGTAVSGPPVLSRRRFVVLGAGALGLAATAAITSADTRRVDGGAPGDLDAEARPLVAQEVDKSIRWLWDLANRDAGSTGFGLVRDRDDSAWVASTAATGFALAAYCIGVDRGVLDRRAVVKRVRGALRTIEQTVPHRSGVVMHFVVPGSGLAARNSEYSTIDTALLLNGAVVAAGYLADPEITERTDRLLRRADWLAYQRVTTDARFLRMAWSDRTKAFVGTWNMSAEQLVLYLLVAGHPDVPPDVARALYAGFRRPVGEYGGHRCVYEPGGTLFTYQYPHAFFPYQRYCDGDGVDWAANARSATLANRAWCADNADRLPAFASGLWGSSASDGPSGYTVNGASPSAAAPRNDGTIAPYSLMGALMTAPAEAGEALLRLRRAYPDAWGPYGFADAVNVVDGRPWVAASRLGIDKGLSAIAGAAALGSTLVHDSFAAHPWIARGQDILGCRPI